MSRFIFWLVAMFTWLGVVSWPMLIPAFDSKYRVAQHPEYAFIWVIGAVLILAELLRECRR